MDLLRGGVRVLLIVHKRHPFLFPASDVLGTGTNDFAEITRVGGDFWARITNFDKQFINYFNKIL